MHEIRNSIVQSETNYIKVLKLIKQGVDRTRAYALLLFVRYCIYVLIIVFTIGPCMIFNFNKIKSLNIYINI